ncbi:flagellar basal body P-ring formation chaperone FlgA [Thermodesulfovibrionales bacterium]|nr:flagellar basal body P-ring formation chaperone FlgA [Thermodesulfovibrionales bacterium]MCL0105962.1 flagellar basal body P-ring formation chaperone FlgA [Thermodesulfovibrionales bacterium]
MTTILRNKILLLIACCLLLVLMPGVSESAEKRSAMNDIRQAVLEKLKKSVSGYVEIHRLRVVRGGDIVDRLDNHTITNLAMISNNGRDRAKFAVHLINRKGLPERITVEASYDAFVDVFIAARRLSRDTILTDDDFSTVRQKLSRLPSGAVFCRSDISGKILTTNIGQGVIIRDNHLTSYLKVRRGQKVRVIVEGDNVTITTHGVLRSNTIVGEGATVLCNFTEREVKGILVSPDTVRVRL